MDVAMPEKDGLEAAREICDFSPQTMIIFATAHEDYTHEAFVVYAFDYLIKPYKIDWIRKTMERIRLKLSDSERPKEVFNSPVKAETVQDKMIREKLNILIELVDDDLEQLDLLSKDADAKVGHKTADTSFFGYKTHIAMTEERIITAAVITSEKSTMANNSRSW